MNKMLGYKTIQLEDVLENKAFFHYTAKKNLESILANGLEPRIGENAVVIERTKKVFFTVGVKNTLIIMDVWIKWLLSRPKNKYIYMLGAFFMTKSYFPKFIYDIIFHFWDNNEKRLNEVLKDFDKILRESVFLILNLEENVDFSFEDIDEVKIQKFPRRFLKNIYKYGSDLDESKMEPWNMHTFSNKKIETEKIFLLQYQENYDCKTILKYLASKNMDFICENCELLKKYLEIY